MINFFKKIKLNSLRKKYRKLLKESNRYSTINRKKSDELYESAMKIENKIIELTSK